MALPAGRYGVTKNQLLKIKKLPMNTIKLIEELTEKFDLLGTAAFKNSTSVVTESSDLVESGAVKDIVGWGNKNLCNYNGANNVVIAQVKNGVTYTFSATSTGHGGFNLKKNDSSGTVIAQMTPMSAGRNSVSFTADSDFSLFLNGYGFGGYTFTEDISDLQLEVGTTATAYEPYHESVEQTLRDAEVIEGENFCLEIPLEIGTISSQGGDGDNNARVRTKLDKKIKFNESREVIFTFSGNASEFAIYQYDSASTDTGSIITDGWVSSGYTFTPNSSKYFRLVFKKADDSAMSVSDVQNLVARYNYLPLKDVVPTKADNSVIGTVEGANASKAWSVGEHFIKDGQFKEVTQPIASGGAISDSNTTNKPIADCLVKQATFSSTTSNTGILTLSIPTGAHVLNVEITNVLTVIYRRASDPYLGVKCLNPSDMTVLSEIAVSGTYYYID